MCGFIPSFIIQTVTGDTHSSTATETNDSHSGALTSANGVPIFVLAAIGGGTEIVIDTISVTKDSTTKQVGCYAVIFSDDTGAAGTTTYRIRQNNGTGTIIASGVSTVVPDVIVLSGVDTSPGTSTGNYVITGQTNSGDKQVLIYSNFTVASLTGVSGTCA